MKSSKSNVLILPGISPDIPMNEKSLLALKSPSFTVIIEDKLKVRSARAKGMLQSGDYQGTIKEYKRMLFLDPNNAEIHKNIAEIFIQNHEYQEALVHLKCAMKLTSDPSILQIIHNLMYEKGLILLKTHQLDELIQFITLGSPNQEQNSLEDFEVTSPPLESVIDLSDQPFVRALAYLSENRKNETITELEKCIQENKQNCYFAILLKAKLLWQMNKIREAFNEYWRASEINSKHPEITEFFKLIDEKVRELQITAQKLIFEGELQKALFFLKKSIETNPKQIKTYLLSCLVNRKMKKYEQAVKDLVSAEACLNQYPEYVQEVMDTYAVTYNEIGIDMLYKDNLSDAITLFNEGLKYRPDDWGIIGNRGDSYFQLKEFDRALVDYEMAFNLSESPSLKIRIGSCYYYQSLSYFNKKEYKKCLELLEEALKHDTDNSDYLVLKGNCYSLQNDSRSAFLCFKSALKKNPLHQEALVHLTHSFHINPKQDENKLIPIKRSKRSYQILLYTQKGLAQIELYKCQSSFSYILFILQILQFLSIAITVPKSCAKITIAIVNESFAAFAIF